MSLMWRGHLQRQCGNNSGMHWEKLIGELISFKIRSKSMQCIFKNSCTVKKT